MKQVLAKRFQKLAMLELLNGVVIFPGFLIFMSRNVPITIYSILALLTVSVLLIIGTIFFFLKSRDLKNRTNTLQHYETAFRALRWIIPLALLIVFIILYGNIFANRTIDTDNLPDIVIRSLLFLLAVLEYINYFHLQLMYDNQKDLAYLMRHKRLKQGVMVREFNW